MGYVADRLVHRYVVVIRVARLGATVARFRAGLAMLSLVLAAFFRAQPADLFAKRNVLWGNLCIALQKTRAKQANIGAIAVQFDAACHHRNIVFLQACGLAGFASKRTVDKGADQVGILLLLEMSLVLHI